MNNRIYSIDFLRAIAIIGMVLSGYIAWNPELPAWLFHAQTPPPTFAFDPSVAGITWVDLVFPFFLFSMGAAFPLALGRKIERGTSRFAIATSILKRGFLLVFFAIALGNLRSANLDGVLHNPVWVALSMLVVWSGFFALFVRIPSWSHHLNAQLNGAGFGLLLILSLFFGIAGMPVSLIHSDVIILILANMVVFGSFVWWVTRRNIVWRLGVIAFLVALKISASVDGSWVATMWKSSPIPWLFHFEYLEYLCVVLPGTIVGDCIVRAMTCDNDASYTSATRRRYVAVGIIAMQLGLVMWTLYERYVFVGVLSTCVSGCLALALLRDGTTARSRLLSKLFTLGWYWLLLGLCFEPFEGGIRKDFATVSYFFVTAGLASWVVMLATFAFDSLHLKPQRIVACGQNPMIAYTVGGYVIIPLLMLAAQVIPIPWLWGGVGCVMSVARGVIVMAAVVVITTLFTRNKIFWRT